MWAICQKYWKGKYYSTLKRVRDKEKGFGVQVGERAEARGSHQQVNQTTLCMYFPRTMLSNCQTGLQTKKSSHFIIWSRNIWSPTQPFTIYNWVTGYDHRCGGKGKSRILPKEHEDKPNQITGPVCSVDFKRRWSRWFASYIAHLCNQALLENILHKRYLQTKICNQRSSWWGWWIPNHHKKHVNNFSLDLNLVYFQLQANMKEI